MRRSQEQWKVDILNYVARFPDIRFSARDLHARLSPGSTGGGGGACRVREACEDLVATGLLELHQQPEGAPYGRQVKYFSHKEWPCAVEDAQAAAG